MGKRSRATCSLLVTALLAASALGDDAAEPVRVRYAAPSPCADPTLFQDGVLRRTAKARPADATEPARLLDVDVRPRGPRWQGSLTMRAIDGSTTVRRVDGATCTEVVDALALVVALAIDPQARTTPAPRPSASVSAPAPAPSPSLEPAPAPVRPPATARPAPATQPIRATEPPPPPAAQWGAGLGLQLSAAWGPAPSALWTVPAFLEASRGPDAPGQLRARLSLARGRSGAVDTTAGSGRFEWTVGRLDGCVTAWQAPWGLRAVPFAALEAGALKGEGEGVDHPLTQTRSWLAAGLGLRLQARVIGPLFAEGQALVAVPMVRDRFFLEPDTTLHRAPALASSVAFGLGSYFL